MNVKTQADALIEQIDAAIRNVEYMQRAEGHDEIQSAHLHVCLMHLERAKGVAVEFLNGNTLKIAPERIEDEPKPVA